MDLLAVCVQTDWFYAEANKKNKKHTLNVVCGIIPACHHHFVLLTDGTVGPITCDATGCVVILAADEGHSHLIEYLVYKRLNSYIPPK